MTVSVMWKNWRQALLIVHPDTLVRWQRGAFSPALGRSVQ
jgi:hypothetical protein